METRTLQCNSQHTEETPRERLENQSGFELQSVQTPIARRAFLAAMCTVLVQEFRAGRGLRQPASPA